MDFKTISIPIMDMEGADESWKTRFHLSNSAIGVIGGSATPCDNVELFRNFRGNSFRSHILASFQRTISQRNPLS